MGKILSVLVKAMGKIWNLLSFMIKYLFIALIAFVFVAIFLPENTVQAIEILKSLIA